MRKSDIELAGFYKLQRLMMLAQNNEKLKEITTLELINYPLTIFTNESNETQIIMK